MNCFKVLAALLLTVSLVGCVSLEDVPEVDGTGEHYIDTYTAPEYVEEETKVAEMAIGSTANKPSTSAETITEQVVLDQAGIKITAKALEKDGWDTGLKVMIENNTDKEITVQARDVCVNGCVIEHTFSSDVTAGMKANDFIRFSESGLERSGITTIADISLKFHIFDGESWDDILDTDEIQIKTSAYEGFQYTYDDSGDLLYNENGIKIVYKGYELDETWGEFGILLYIENNSGEYITVQTRDNTINGFMMDGVMSDDIPSGKKSFTDITFWNSEFEENDISIIEESTFSFEIYVGEGWDDTIKTDIFYIDFIK